MSNVLILTNHLILLLFERLSVLATPLCLILRMDSVFPYNSVCTERFSREDGREIKSKQIILCFQRTFGKRLEQEVEASPLGLGSGTLLQGTARMTNKHANHSIKYTDHNYGKFTNNI